MFSIASSSTATTLLEPSSVVMRSSLALALQASMAVACQCNKKGPTTSRRASAIQQIQVGSRLDGLHQVQLIASRFQIRTVLS
jgi:hypothetical protein